MAGVGIWQYRFKVVAHRDIHIPLFHHGFGLDEDDHAVVLVGLFAAHTPFVTYLVGELAGFHAFETFDRNHTDHIAGGVIEGDKTFFQLIDLLAGHNVGEVVDQARWVGAWGNLCETGDYSPP